MLNINMSDVVKVLSSCSTQLIGLGIALLVALIVIIAVRKLPAALRKLVRSECLVAMVLALAISVNSICFGPMATMISLATGDGTITDESAEAANELCEEIAGEGIVLLKNENNALPLTDTKQINVFGWAASNPCYGGTGSGSLSDAYDTVTLLEGLENAGIKYNTELIDFYTNYCSVRPTVAIWSQDWTLPEPPADTYTQEMLSNAEEFSDTAMIVISRLGGEGADLPTDMGAVINGTWSDGTIFKAGYYTNNSEAYDDFEAGDHYLQLSRTEEDMVKLVCENFEHVIVVYNGTNTLELGWTDEYAQIESVIWCPGPGQTGFNALGKVLTGEINPSGKTADTFVYDLTASPTWNNFGSFTYDNMSEYDSAWIVESGYQMSETHPSFVNYVESIYVGYRFYETAAAEGFLNYEETVQYPFGYGLSYTEFRKEMSAMTEQDGVLTFDVTVTNTGDAAGKDVIEIYYNPPYTNGGIEKSSANLIWFDKTVLLQPGDSQTMTVTISVEDMASYDEEGYGCYVLEAGDYVISLNSDSHTVLASQTYTQETEVVYDEDNPRSTDLIAAVNLFQDAKGDVTYLSRADGFANYAEATAAPASYSMSEEHKATFICNSNYDPSSQDDPDAEMPVTGAKNGLTLADLRGLDYDDPLWDDLLDQLTVEDMDLLISRAGYQTQAIESVGKVATLDCDGPAAIINNFNSTASIGFACALMQACSWNEDLSYAFGSSIGTMASEMDVSGWYAPAMNTHRSAFGGRNYEYYSEDGYLAGKMASQAVQGSASQGVYAYIKHFALNDQESNRMCMLCTWATEQSIREIYLKPFEIAVKEGHATAVMTAYNYIGTTAAGAHSALLNTVLRGEWGFVGMCLTDYFSGMGFQNADQQIRNGNDACLISYSLEEAHVNVQSASGVQAMRQSCKNILYTVVNSNAYENGGTIELPAWQITAYVIDVVLAAALILLEIRICRLYRQRKAQ